MLRVGEELRKFGLKKRGKDSTKEALLKLYSAQKGEDSSPEMIEGLTATFGQWYVKTIEDVGVGREKIKEVF